MSIKYTSWKKLKKNKNIQHIQDPILSIYLSKEHFEDSYKIILNKLTAEPYCIDSTIEYYFEVNPLKKDTLIFKDENKKLEFYELGIETKSITPFDKICDGTQNED